MDSLETNPHIPFYTKVSQIMIGLVAFFFIMYIGQNIIKPLIFATIFAILINPLVNFFVKKKLNRIVAIALSLLIGIVLLTALIYFILYQTSRFSDSIPQLKERFGLLTAQFTNWVSSTLSIETGRVNEWIGKLKAEAGKNSSTMIGQTLSTLGSLFVVGFILPVYVFTILYYKPLLLEVIGKSFPKSNHKTVSEVLTETKSLIQNYLIGLLIEAAIVATLNSVGLLIIGIHYAILIGLIGALLNMIPYIGGIVAVALPMVMALAYQSPVTALWVLLLYAIVQFVDNQYIVPYIVASKVKINALASIVIVLIGNALWGISGMFLAIPLTAILKVVFDRIENLKPLGLLLGDDMPTGKPLLNLNLGRKKSVKKEVK